MICDTRHPPYTICGKPQITTTGSMKFVGDFKGQVGNIDTAFVSSLIQFWPSLTTSINNTNQRRTEAGARNIYNDIRVRFGFRSRFFTLFPIWNQLQPRSRPAFTIWPNFDFQIPVAEIGESSLVV
ncbi:hypothetical protein J6590_029261 [Homalodisca vitripennis]|nr:hypothetical protein J6590_029261 [Homalodisca vitripennis]